MQVMHWCKRRARMPACRSPARRRWSTGRWCCRQTMCSIGESQREERVMAGACMHAGMPGWRSNPGSCLCSSKAMQRSLWPGIWLHVGKLVVCLASIGDCQHQSWPILTALVVNPVLSLTSPDPPAASACTGAALALTSATRQRPTRCISWTSLATTCQT